ncbi:hypothetical protein JCM6882_009139 [Rhodosporidiobolus microsporus]
MLVNSNPSSADCARIEADLKPRRRKAKRHPLSSGDILTFNGPSLRPDALPALDRTPSTTAGSLAAPHRPVNRRLLDRLAHAPPGAVHRLTLVQPIQAGKDEFSQVWRVEVEAGGRREPAMLKLFVEALFPYPREHNSRAWQPAGDFADAEAASYAAFSTLQGGVVPYCYGFYQFPLPFGETVIGVLLEDLSDLATPLPTWLARQRRRKLRQQRQSQLSSDSSISEDSSVDSSDSEVDPDEEILELEDVKPTLDLILESLRRLQSAGRANFRFLPSDILVVGSEPSRTQVIKTGFATSCSVQEIAEYTDRENRERLARYGEGVVNEMVWEQVEQHMLVNLLGWAVSLELMEEYSEACNHFQRQ